MFLERVAVFVPISLYDGKFHRGNSAEECFSIRDNIPRCFLVIKIHWTDGLIHGNSVTDFVRFSFTCLEHKLQPINFLCIHSQRTLSDLITFSADFRILHHLLAG